MAPFWRRPAPARTALTCTAPQCVAASTAEYRRAAVLILLYPDGDSYRMPLIVRATGSSPHAGQIGLPGGALEGDETEIAAACREAEEELAIDPRGLEILGTLSPLVVEVSRYTVVPVIARALRVPDFKPAPAEVAAWFSVPLEELLDPSNLDSATVSHLGRSVDVPCFRLAGHIVWGATAMALAEFAALLRGCAGCIDI